MESRLDQALQENEFVVYYQPKVSMKDGSIIGSEALIRWNHPDKGFLMPGVFIPIFEKNGMVKKVDLWLFEEVCKTMRTWSEKGYPLFLFPAIFQDYIFNKVISLHESVKSLTLECSAPSFRIGNNRKCPIGRINDYCRGFSDT